MASHTSPELATAPASPSRRGRGRVMMAIVIFIVLALLIPPLINVNRYRARVAAAVGRTLGRQVTVSNIELELLPRPGLVLSNFVLADDQAFSPEPMLRADSVIAYPHLSSLWRGRLEIGTLELENPSLNLVRRPDGHWNLEELIQRSSQVPSAPTTAQHTASRLRFPYIEATSGRINFKLGQVKKAFALTDADFALWQQTDNEWGVRLEARPMRTDVSLSDTGTLKMDGRFQRASMLRDTPVDLKIDFSRGQLGQMTKLIYGRDRGWRGGVSGSAVLSGRPARLTVTLNAAIDDFRRYDIARGEAIRLQVHCTGTYSSPDDSLNSVSCESPVTPGNIRITASAKNWGADGYEISARGDQVPMERVIAFARHVKKDLPDDLTAVGYGEAVFDIRKGAGEPLWAGGGHTSHFALRSNVLKEDVQLGQLEFVVPGVLQASADSARKLPAKKPKAPSQNAGFGLVLKPFALPLGAPSPASASGYFDDANYRVTLSGEAEMTRLINIAHALGLGTPGIGLAGNAEVDIDIAGVWTGFAQPVPTGRLLLRRTTAELQGISEPLLIDSATATLAEGLVRVSGLSAGFAKGPQLTGSASFPLHCTDPDTCILHFALHANEASLRRANELLNPKASQPWYHLLALGQQQHDALARLHGNGTFAIDHLEIGTMPAMNMSGTLALDAGKVRADGLHAETLGGTMTGTWIADFTVSPPQFSGDGVLSRVSMAQAAALMKDNWATGSVDASYKITMAGTSADELRASAVASADFSWNAGLLRHVVLEGRGTPMTFTNFGGTVSLSKERFAISNAKLQSLGVVYNVTGTAAFDRAIDFRLDRGNGHSYLITGPLDKPHVESASAPSSEALLR